MKLDHLEKSSKKRLRKKGTESIASHLSEKTLIDNGEGVGTQINDNEPTIADKLATLDFVKNEGDSVLEKQDSMHKHPPSADSIHVLLNQALHADDRALLLECLHNQDEKVIVNSVSMLSPTNIIKLLDSLSSVIQSKRGTVLAHALPWLKFLLCKHTSMITSQESTLSTLNSLFQFFGSRAATLEPALQLATSLDFLLAGDDDDGHDEYESVPPVIYDDTDESEGDESEVDDAMDTNQGSKEAEESSGISDIDGSEYSD